MTDYPDLQLFIDNRWRRTTESLPVLNPATEEEIGRLPVAGQAELEDALDAAERGFRIWSRTAPRRRIRRLCAPTAQKSTRATSKPSSKAVMGRPSFPQWAPVLFPEKSPCRQSGAGASDYSTAAR